MKQRSHRLITALSLALCTALVFTMTACGGGKSEYQKNANLDTSKNVNLTIASGSKTWPQMESVIAKFTELYPNCTIVCEFIEEYADNLPVRLNQTEEKIDIFKTNNIQENTSYKDNALNLISEDSKKILNLSDTNPGLVENFRYTAAENTQYAIPIGGEMRGMYVNKTLLKKNGLEVPTNRAELMHCCEVLYNNGYVPFQSANGTFAQQLLYPYICNSVVNGGKYEETYAALEDIDDGISEYFRDAYTFLYEIVEKGYFDYKRVEETYGYSFEGSDGKARDFLNITKVSDDLYEKQDDVGQAAFILDTLGFTSALEKVKSDYHSEIEYEFILSPVMDDGGCAYLSPASGLAVNNRSDNIDWALEFLNFLFSADISASFAEESDMIANTKDALLKYDVPADHTSDVGQMTFSYPFYKTVTTLMMGGYDDMIGMSKMNNKKYMTDNGDGTYSLPYTVDDYLKRLETEFQLAKSARENVGN